MAPAVGGFPGLAGQAFAFVGAEEIISALASAAELRGAFAFDLAFLLDEAEDGVAFHHDEVRHIGIWGILISAADATSASRPGARSETMTTYLKRLEDLERIGTSFEGVEKCFAVQAGRELRVLEYAK